ncbi:MAG: hypothetical protein QM661_15065 [Solimonas sp.]
MTSLWALLDDITGLMDDVAVMTFGVYGLVALRVRFDDMGAALVRGGGCAGGRELVRCAQDSAGMRKRS